MSSSRPPKYCRNRQKNRADRAYCKIKGERIELGVYGSPESRAKYAAVVGDKKPEPSANLSVSEVLISFLEWASAYYDDREFGHFMSVAKLLRRHVGTAPAVEFGPKRLKAVREEMIRAGWARKNINRQVVRIRQFVTWAVGEEIIPATNLEALRSVKGLRKGHTDARETEPVRPVPAGVVEATIAKLPEVVADMVEVQMLTGMRPGELIIMRPMDIDRDREIWRYTPESHKTKYRGHHRTVAIGPKAQAVLLRYLVRAADACCFQPIDSEAKRRAAITTCRKLPLSAGNRVGTNRKRNPKKNPGTQYSVDSYRRAITTAAKTAEVEHWTPHRLRHSKATQVRKQFGLDSVQAVLGHRGAKVSEIYAELDTSKAEEVARRLG